MTVHLDKLLLLVDEEIENNPVSHLGMVWCALSQDEIAERLGCSTKTVRRILPARRYGSTLGEFQEGGEPCYSGQR